MQKPWQKGNVAHIIVGSTIAIIVGTLAVTGANEQFNFIDAVEENLAEEYIQSDTEKEKMKADEDSQAHAGPRPTTNTRGDGSTLLLTDGAEVSHEGETEGNQCDDFMDCDGELYCRETADEFTRYEKACCPTLHKWDGSRCIDMSYQGDEEQSPSDDGTEEDDTDSLGDWREGEGTECSSNWECMEINSLLSCRETTEDALFKEKACCVPPGHWNGNACVHLKGESCVDGQCAKGLSCQPRHPTANLLEYDAYCCPPGAAWDGKKCVTQEETPPKPDDGNTGSDTDGNTDDSISDDDTDTDVTPPDDDDSDTEPSPRDGKRGKPCDTWEDCGVTSDLYCEFTTTNFKEYEEACCPLFTYWNGSQCIDDIVDDTSTADSPDGADEEGSDTQGDDETDESDTTPPGTDDEDSQRKEPGIKCSTSFECNDIGTGYTCTETTDDFTEYKKACCRGGHWNGKECVTLKGERCQDNSCSKGLSCKRVHPDANREGNYCCPSGKRWDGSQCAQIESTFVTALVPIAYSNNDLRSEWQSTVSGIRNYLKNELPFRENTDAIEIVAGDANCNVVNAASEGFRPANQEQFEQKVKQCGNRIAQEAGHPNGAQQTGVILGKCLNAEADSEPCGGVVGYTKLSGFFVAGADKKPHDVTAAHEIGHTFRLCEGYKYEGLSSYAFERAVFGGRCGTERIEQKFPADRSATDNAPCGKCGPFSVCCKGRVLTNDPINPLSNGRDIMGPAGIDATRKFACDSYLAFQDVAREVHGYPLPRVTESEINACMEHIEGDMVAND